MTTMISEVYEALRSIGVDEPKARSAAAAMTTQGEKLDAIERDLAVLKWMVGTTAGLTLIVLGKLLLAH
jgi:hypothetical protein